MILLSYRIGEIVMKKYELMAIYKPNLDAEKIDKAVDALSKVVKDLKR